MERITQLITYFKTTSHKFKLISAALALSALYLKYRDNRPDKTIPYAHYDFPIFGNMLFTIYQIITKEEGMGSLLEDIRKYGKFWFHLPTVGVQLFFSDPPTIKMVLEDLETFNMSPVRRDIMYEVLGNGIFLSNGESWAHQRNLAKPIFSVSSRQEMFDVYHKCAKNLVAILNEEVKNKTTIELQQLFKRFTLDTFCEIGFGCTINSLKKPIEFSTTFDWLLKEVDDRLIFPWRKVFFAATWKEHIDKIEQFITGIIEERKREGWKGKGDFLSVLLEMEEKKEITGVTPKFLRDQVINFTIAGRDTTAVLLSATFYYLALHPDVDQKVRREIEEIVGNEEVTMQHTKELKYLQNVLNESLRLFPPAVPFNSRITTRPVVLPNGARLPQGTQVVYSPYCVHRLKEYWGEDAEQFVPERWEKPDILKHPYQYVPFQKGPRICLGMNMAHEEAKACISILYQNGFKFELVAPKGPMMYTGVAIMLSKEGILMNVQNLI
eukprot:TRINITY_DN2747_c0_g1_i1.p1 TRINITY_DN2747_c0_g1~~TRINITY_DN2747_c0_g1_i1.p1  ORF type:complete len:496 (-),score=135.39 TRINITY_DN2747_c0_g1_i1:24-1511(-)